MRGIVGYLERDLHMTLRRKIVDLVRRDLLEQAVETARVDKIAVMQKQTLAEEFRIVVEMVDPASVERTRPTDDPMDLVTFFEQDLR